MLDLSLDLTFYMGDGGRRWRMAETFKDFPPSSLPLIKSLLSNIIHGHATLNSEVDIDLFYIFVAKYCLTYVMVVNIFFC